MSWRGAQLALALLIMAAISGLLGFVIIYHYASLERPIQHFAIVIDAGSTQTRSSLFTVHLDVPNLVDWMNTIDDDETSSGQVNRHLPLTDLFRVRQVATCVNGPPLAAVSSPEEAQKLVDNCVGEFGAKIGRLKFSGNENQLAGEIQAAGCPDSEAVKYPSGGINSVTHLYLGATAGMRALVELNETSANEKIDWINRAIRATTSSGRVKSRKGSDVIELPPINEGFIGIISGSDEATFGWTSVNFVCETLEVPKPALRDIEIAQSPADVVAQNTSTLYHIQDTSTSGETSNNATSSENTIAAQDNHRPLESVGTLELGGTSAQMAFQLDQHDTSVATDNSSGFDLRELELFNGKYLLATRSDLCLGMSQAILRANFIVLRNYFDASTHDSVNLTTSPITHLELVNPCLQNTSLTELSGPKLLDFLDSPCLVEPKQSSLADDFQSSMRRMSRVTFVGTGESEQCASLLTNLIEPHLCSRYFSLCPDRKSSRPAPPEMPFVTISGYNHALRALTHLLTDKGSLMRRSNSTRLETTIARKFGGHSVDHALFVQETRRFCSLDAATLVNSYQIDEHYHKVQCLQLVYINKLLTEFYGFRPATSWRQVKFLVFPPEETAASTSGSDTYSSQGADCGGGSSSTAASTDIGWTLGLLLNATSHHFGGGEGATETGGGGDGHATLFYHHGASVIFILRATLMLMFGCVLLALALIVTAVVGVRHRQRKAYISPAGSRNSVQSSWCSSLNQV